LTGEQVGAYNADAERSSVMNSLKLRSRVGADGVLNLRVPVGVTNAEVEVIVVFQLVESAQTPKTPEELGWPPGFFEQTVGAWAGEPLLRGEQGEYEVREEMALHERREDYEAGNKPQ
jgi:hypothetical protein